VKILNVEKNGGFEEKKWSTLAKCALLNKGIPVLTLTIPLPGGILMVSKQPTKILGIFPRVTPPGVFGKKEEMSQKESSPNSCFMFRINKKCGEQ